MRERVKMRTESHELLERLSNYVLHVIFGRDQVHSLPVRLTPKMHAVHSVLTECHVPLEVNEVHTTLSYM